ncbi:hypothetical protein WR25_16678 isoform E [Diploscapter pachys]|uniref:Myosin motor domain-containing protein n=1 Tax=Diploscapter pachys TaxID=2018661 RepID=A0A2A2LTU7_9BILA|nr:hypothetical protein WR25_16678 isoform A [Diploscapter pachys]PAV89640.1 hypothetical protein WR25_16678 isoform D [Diploscapter pachys]PAV89641.1 hypothetical protein WR25_16678 isoform E [Diploscapter pachys]
MGDLQCLQVQRSALTDSAAADEWASKKLCYVPDPNEGFLLGSIKSETDDEVVVELLGSGKQVRLSKDDVQKANPPKFDRVEDMSGLTYLNEASVLHNLKERYYSNLIYTYSGLFCVVINPYKKLPIYSESLIEQFKGKKRDEMPPHIFAIADAAYRSMLQEREDQSILCTGESGAGKTENTKKIIQYLAHVAGASRSKIPSTNLSPSKGELEQQLLQANPILEAFGNSKTVKNDNSSRFGKFIKINFDMSGYISGANIEHYLLEKSRVLRQAADERSFHIFYQLLRGTDKQSKESYLLDSIDSYRFLVNGGLNLPNVDDAVEFRNTLNSMKIMGFADEEIDSILRIVSATLLLGNIEFQQERNSDQAILPDDTVIQKACHLLGLHVVELAKAFLRPRIKVGREFVNKAQSKEQAEFAVEAIAKANYERMFKWLVQRINRSLDKTGRQGASFIGILDIAGFEIFEMNSFEQLCINYTNEKLQQLFNNTMFILEQEEYQKEGIQWDFIDFGLDLQPTIDLIEKPMGVLALLDEECLFPKATDKTFVDKLQKTHNKHAKFIVPEMRAKSHFAIVHYAGRVDYQANEWLNKNMDPLNDNVVAQMQSSSDPFVAGMWKDAEFAGICAAEMNDTAFGMRIKRGMFRTVSQMHKEQLSKLMQTLRCTSPHFVRCIIPNHEKKPGKVNSNLVLEQLRCNGVLEGIRICRQGFPNRVPFQEFRHRYELLCPNAIPKNYIDGKESVRLMITSLEIDPNLYRIGQSKVFFRTGVLALLEEDREKKLCSMIVAFQAECRAALARKLYSRKMQQSNAIRVIQRNGLAYLKLRNWQWWRLFTKVKPLVQISRAEDLIQEKEYELSAAKEKLTKMETECTEHKTRLEQLESERNSLKNQLNVEVRNMTELEEFRGRLQKRAEELELDNKECRDRLTEQEQTLEVLQKEKRKTMEALKDLETQLEQEEQAKQKMVLDKNNSDTRNKALAEKIVELQDTIDKLLKEKRILEEKVNTLVAQLTEYEEKTKHGTKAKGKLEQQLHEFEQDLQREKQQRTDVEGQKRKLLAELEDNKDLLEEREAKVRELTAHLAKREEELTRQSTKNDEDGASIALLQRQIRDMQLTVDELREDLEIEKTNKNKAEVMRREISAQLEKMKVDVLDKADESTMLQDIIARKDEEVAGLKRDKEKEVQALEGRFEETKNRLSKQIDELHEELEVHKKKATQLDKNKTQLEQEREEVTQELAVLHISKLESDKKRKQQESQIFDLQQQLSESNENRRQTLEQLDKAREELDSLSRAREQEEVQLSAMTRKIVTLEEQITELTEKLQEETRLKIANINRCRQLEEEKSAIMDERDELENAKVQLQRDLQTSQNQLVDARKKADEGIQMQLEELKKKYGRDMENLQQQLAEKDAVIERANQSKKKAQQDSEDLNIELENLRASNRELEKRQKKFDQLLAEERANVQKALHERDSHAQESRDRETRILSLMNELESLKSDFEQVDRQRRQQQQELNDLISSKDDVGKNAHEQEKARRLLEQVGYENARTNRNFPI